MSYRTEYSGSALLGQLSLFKDTGRGKELADLVIRCCGKCESEAIAITLRDRFPRAPNYTVFGKIVAVASLFAEKGKPPKNYNETYRELMDCCSGVLAHHRHYRQ